MKSVLPLCLLLFSPCALGQEPAPPCPVKAFTGKPAHPVVDVADGESVLLEMEGKKTKVRLIGVNAPGTLRSPNKAEPFGEESSRFLRNLLKGESVYVEHEKVPADEDEYGRPLVYLYRAPDNMLVNLELIRAGYGTVSQSYSFHHRDSFAYYQSKAQADQKGIWATLQPQ